MKPKAKKRTKVGESSQKHSQIGSRPNSRSLPTPPNQSSEIPFRVSKTQSAHTYTDSAYNSPPPSQKGGASIEQSPLDPFRTHSGVNLSDPISSTQA